jgi:Flp pilus assembly protein TadG
VTVPVIRIRAAAPPARPAASACSRDRGQALVEFAAVLLPLILVLVGIVQFGFLFSAYVGTSNAAREAGRAATVHRFDPNEDQATNDLARCQEALTAATASLDDGVPGQFSGSCATANGGGDFSITYPDSATCVGTSRTGCQVEITLTYRQPLFVPLIGQFLTADAQNRVSLQATVTMVLN